MPAVSDADVEAWRAAVGRRMVQSERLDRLALHRYARAAGCGSEDAAPLPHWAFFLPCPVDAELGPDGHPMRGAFLPPVTLPRRMFAAAEIVFAEALEFGAEAELTSTVADVQHKAGRSGDLVFVEVERTLAQSGVVRVRERQSFVYRAAGERLPMPVPAAEPLSGELWQPDEVNLFRFSAATFNGHRIHYDRPYAMGVEGYPALVVHGPFTAARLAMLAMREAPLAQFSFRAMAPLFVGQPIRLRRAGDDTFEAVRCDGVTAMQAKVRYR